MNTDRAVMLFVVLVVAWIDACSTGSSDRRAAGSPGPSAPQKATTTTPALAKPEPAALHAAAPCGRDFTEPALMQRAGRAHIELKGAGLSIDVVDAPAICGPLYNADVNALGVHAGDGLQFEACVPDGILQIASEGRSAGAQRVHTGQQPSGAEITFEARTGETYSAHGAATDSLVFGADLWQATSTLVLHAVDGDGEVTANVTIDCTTQTH